MFRWKNKKNVGFSCSIFQITSKVEQFCEFWWIIISEKIHSLFIFKKIFKVDKKLTFSIEEMRNSGNYVYDYARSFFGEDF